MSFFTNFFSSFKNASQDIFSPTKAASFPLLKIKDLCVCYGSKSILHEISFGIISALLGTPIFIYFIFKQKEEFLL